MDRPGFWVVTLATYDDDDNTSEETVGPFASDEEADRWADTRSSSWYTTRVILPDAFDAGRSGGDTGKAGHA